MGSNSFKHLVSCLNYSERIPHVVIAKVLDCDLEERVIELQLPYYINFRKGRETHSAASYGFHVYWDTFVFNYLRIIFIFFLIDMFYKR